MSAATGPGPAVRPPGPSDPVRRDGDVAVPVGARCTACGALAFPYRPTCAGCHGGATEVTGLAPLGTLYTHSTVSVGRDGPYTLGYVDLDDGVRLLARVRGQARIDARVQVVGAEGEAVVVEVLG